LSKSAPVRSNGDHATTDEIESNEWHERMSFTSYGVTVGIRTNRKGVLDQILHVLPPGWKSTRSRNVKRLYSFVTGAKERLGKYSRINVVYADRERIAGTPKLYQATAAFESDLQLFVADNAPHRVFVHAGVVALRGKAIVIPGRSFSGKTSLVAALVKAGATYYSDEYAVLDEHGRVHHYARPLSIRQKGLNGKPRKYKVEALGGKAGNKPLQVGMVVVSKYKPGAQWRPRGLSAGEGALELMANTVSARRQPKAMLEAIHKVVSLAPVLKSERGDASQVVEYLFEKLAGS
jgi:hypothetical protein